MGEIFGARNVFEALSAPTWEGARFGGAPFLLVVTVPRALFSFPLTATHGRGPLFRGQGVMEGYGEKQAEAHVACSGKYFVSSSGPRFLLLQPGCFLSAAISQNGKWKLKHYIK